MSEHSPGSGQVLILAEVGKQFLAVVGGAALAKTLSVHFRYFLHS